MINIDNLIKMGEEVWSTQDGTAIEVIEASDWIQLCKNYFHRVIKDNYQLRIFSKIADEPQISDGTYYHVSQVKQMLSIVKACKAIPLEYRNISDKYIVLREILNNFSAYVATSLRRSPNRQAESNKFRDEYDIQDAIYSILKLIFRDVRREEYIPSRIGANSRADFYIPELKTVLEIKYASENLRDKKLGEEIIIDIERYKGNVLFENYLFLIYDPKSLLANAQGLIEIEKNNNQIEVIIVP